MAHPADIDQMNTVPLPETLMQMISGAWVTQAIYVAAKLGIADLLKQGAKSSQELAEATGVDALSLYRVLRALASIGIFAEAESQTFELTPLAQYLRTDVPGSMRAIAIMYGGEAWRWQAWGEILYSVKTGKPAFDQVNGMPIFSYFSQNPEAAEVFDQAMTSFGQILNAAITAGYDFSSIKTLVDVGGGHGSLLAAILRANPTIQGILYDLPPVVASAQQHLGDLTSRCQVIGGDFFESVPAGGDTYMLKNVIHDWGDEQAITILQNCHQVMAEDGKLLLVETVISPDNEPSMGMFLDLEMLVMSSGGRERTEAQFRKLMSAANFELTRITPTQGPLCVIEGVKA